MHVSELLGHLFLAQLFATNVNEAYEEKLADDLGIRSVVPPYPLVFQGNEPTGLLDRPQPRQLISIIERSSTWAFSLNVPSFSARDVKLFAVFRYQMTAASKTNGKGRPRPTQTNPQVRIDREHGGRQSVRRTELVPSSATHWWEIRTMWREVCVAGLRYVTD